MSDTSTGNNLTFNKVYDLISGDASESQFRGISGSVMERPWIVDALLRGVSDSNPFLTMYSRNGSACDFVLLQHVQCFLFCVLWRC